MRLWRRRYSDQVVEDLRREAGITGPQPGSPPQGYLYTPASPEWQDAVNQITSDTLRSHGVMPGNHDGGAWAQFHAGGNHVGAGRPLHRCNNCGAVCGGAE